MSLNIYWQFPKFTEVYWYIYENVSKYVGFVEAIYEIFSKYFFWHDVTLVLCWLMYRWSSADWCTAGPLLIYVLLVLCWLIHSTAGPLKCTTGPLLTDVQYSWSYADWCTARPLLPDVLLVLCCLLPCQSATDWRNVHYFYWNGLAHLLSFQ